MSSGLSLENAGILLGLVQPPPLQGVVEGDGITLSVDERVSVLMNDVLPSYISEEFPLFVEFLKTYFEWAEEFGNPRAEAVRMTTYIDIDQTLSNFLDFFKSEYLYGFNEVTSGMSTEKLVKIAKDLYERKGDSESINFLFKLVFGVEASVSYPKDLLLTLSDSNIDIERILKTTRVNLPADFEGVVGGRVSQKVTSRFSGEICSAFIDDFDLSQNNGLKTCTIKLKDISGTFIPNKEIEFSKGSTTFYETCLPLISSVDVGLSGSGHAINDTISITDSSGNLVATTFVSAVGRSGDIESVAPIDSRSIFLERETYTATINTNGTGSSLDVIGNKAVSQDRKKFLSDKSLLSSESRLPDNNKYQTHSYVIRAEKQLSDYADILRKVCHPAGTKFFSEHLIKRTFNATTFDFRPPESDADYEIIKTLEGTGTYQRGDTINLLLANGNASATAEVVRFTPSGISLPDPFTFGTVSLLFSSGVSAAATQIKSTRGLFNISATAGAKYSSITNDNLVVNAKIGNYTPATFNMTADFRGETYGTTFADYYPTGYNGLTLASLGTFSSGSAVTHDPKTAGFTPGAMGSISAGTLNPEAYGFTFDGVTAGTTLVGYTVENIDQLVMISGTDSTTADHWNIYRHPKNLVNGITSSIQTLRRIRFFTETTVGVSGSLTAGFTIGNTVVQRDTNMTTAIGTIVGSTIAQLSTISSSNLLSVASIESSATGGLGLAISQPSLSVSAQDTSGVTFSETIAIDVISGEFTNEYNQKGSKIKMIALESGAERFIAGTGGIDFISDTSVTTDIAMQHINIQDFTDNMRIK
mgnify:CR=1 FL=1